VPTPGEWAQSYNSYLAEFSVNNYQISELTTSPCLPVFTIKHPNTNSAEEFNNALGYLTPKQRMPIFATR
jgi:hypothetical protein